MNKVTLTGRTCHNNEIKYTSNGKAVLQNSIAVKRNYKNADGEYETDFINLVFWGNQAEYIAKYAPKGSLIGVTGRWKHRDYTKVNGETRYVDECEVEDCEILVSNNGNNGKEQDNNEGSGKQQHQQQKEENPFDPNDLPF